MLHKNIIKLSALLWCVLTVASCTNEDFDKGNNGPDVPEGLPVTLKLNIGAPDVTVVETKALDNGETFGQILLLIGENGMMRLTNGQWNFQQKQVDIRYMY